MAANGFEAFDISSWVVDGLATHLSQQRAKTNARARIWPASAGKLRLLLPAAAAIAGVTVFASAYHASTAEVASQHTRGVSSSAGQSLGHGYVSGAARFADEAAQVIAALGRGIGPAAPPETLHVAQLLVDRLGTSNSDDMTWMTTLAVQLAKLHD